VDEPSILDWQNVTQVDARLYVRVKGDPATMLATGYFP
jgi:hypothetical protein